MRTLKTKAGEGGVAMWLSGSLEKWKSIPYRMSQKLELSCTLKDELRFRNRSAWSKTRKLIVSTSGHRSKGRGRIGLSSGYCVKELKREIFRVGEMRLDSQQCEPSVELDVMPLEEHADSFQEILLLGS